MDSCILHFVRVLTDERAQLFWVVATLREDAVDRVLDVVPEGWAAVLLDQTLSDDRDIRHLAAGDVRELNTLAN